MTTTIQDFDYSIDFSLPILWQYAEATNLLNLIAAKQVWYNTNFTQFWTNWYKNVFNLLTANSFGLSVWSYILNLPLYSAVAPEPLSAPIWGFNKYSSPFNLTGTVVSGDSTITGLPSLTGISLGAKVSDGAVNIPANTIVTGFIGTTGVTINNAATGSATESITFTSFENHYLNFGNSNFSSLGSVLYLTLEEQRFILRLRYFQLSTRGDITDINKFLNYLITTSNIGYTGTIYALDDLDMTMTYVFTADDMSPNLRQVLIDLDLLPRPAGVGLKYYTSTGAEWAFGIYRQNFSHGNFINGFN